MEMRSPYWASVRCLNRNPASVKLLIEFEGTYELVGENAYQAVKWALEVRVAPADAGVAL